MDDRDEEIVRLRQALEQIANELIRAEPCAAAAIEGQHCGARDLAKRGAHIARHALGIARPSGRYKMP